jgi:ADP-heptose:LPS heptosyltransferase
MQHYDMPRLLRKDGRREESGDRQERRELQVLTDKSIHWRILYMVRHALPTLLLACIVRRRNPEQPLGTHPRILVTRMDGIGDFILLIPFLRELRRNYPSSSITLVVGQNVAQLATPCPYVNEVLVLDMVPKKTSFTSYLKYMSSLTGHLRHLVEFAYRHLAGRIDIAIQPRWDADLAWATLITLLSGAARTIGYSEKTSELKSWCNFGHDCLFTDLIPPGAEQHEAERNLDIIRYLGGSVESSKLEIWRQPEDDVQADRFLNSHKYRDCSLLIAFGLGAAKASRRWPFYGELIRLLARDFNFTPLLIAGSGEEEIVQQITAASPSAAVMQEMPLGVVASVLSRCILFVGNDSGPMHLASALGLPVIEISCHPIGGQRGHENHPDRFGSLATQKRVVRPRTFLGNCEKGCQVESAPHCIASISAEEVAAEVIQLIQSIGTRIA